MALRNALSPDHYQPGSIGEIGKVDDSDRWLCPLEVFTGLHSTCLGNVSMPLQKFTISEKIEQERANAITDVEVLHRMLEEGHKKAPEKNTQTRIKA